MGHRNKEGTEDLRWEGKTWGGEAERRWGWEVCREKQTEGVKVCQSEEKYSPLSTRSTDLDKDTPRGQLRCPSLADACPFLRLSSALRSKKVKSVHINQEASSDIFCQFLLIHVSSRWFLPRYSWDQRPCFCGGWIWKISKEMGSLLDGTKGCFGEKGIRQLSVSLVGLAMLC